MQQTGVRVTNQRAILVLIALEPGQSAAELARKSGLAPQTVSAILDDLDAMGLLKRGEVLRGRRGQPATPLFIEPTGAYALGLEIGWRHIEAVLVDLMVNVVANYRRDYPFPDARTIFKESGQVLAQLTEKLPPAHRNRIIALGVAAPGGIGRNIGLLGADASHGRLWQQTDFMAEMSKLTTLPVQLYNDGTAACWAELAKQPKPRPTEFVYLHIGTFVGAGIVAEGTLREGPSGNSANLGSMLVTDRQGEPFFLHLIGSIYAFEGILTGAGVHVPPTTPMFWPWDEWEDHIAQWISEAAPAIARVLINTSAVIEYSKAVIDGELPSDILDRLIDEVRKEMNLVPILTFEVPRIEKGNLGHAAPSVGAAILPLYRRFFSRDPEHMQDASHWPTHD